MTAKNFSNALGNIGEGYVDEAVRYTPKRKRSPWVKWGSIAACMLLILTGVILGDLLHSADAPNDGVASYFVITAHAANGESTELSFASSSCFNSGTAQGNIFGVDMPTFNFSVKPSDLKNNEVLYERFDILISYNGIQVGATDKNEHIMVFYLVHREPSDEPWAWSVSGWFTEPTDLVVRIVDKESRETVETITVNVKYLADKQEYELKITELNTKFAQQKRAVDANNFLMSILLARNGADYPAWFGGCYIEDDKLYVKLVSPTEEEFKSISDALAYFDDVVVFESAERSMAELQAYADQTAAELMQFGYDVTSWYVDSITGNIVISVLEKDLEVATAWVTYSKESGKDPQVVVEIGEYTVPDSQAIEFCADPFLQNNSLSWMYSINVKIDNEKIYLNEILYDQVSYIDNLELDFSQLAPGPYVNEKITEVLDRISSQKGCYLLKTQSESSCGKELAMYVIDDTYYFVRFFDNGSIMRIHSGSVK